MNTNTLFKSLLATALVATLLTVVLFGLLTVEINLPLVGTIVAYGTTLAIFGLAAFDGVKRTT